MFAIVIHEKGGAERREVFDGTEISVGRVQGNDLMLPKGNVSKRHARLLYREGRVIVTDLNSTNGTYVNRHRIKQATIVREGDRLYIGDFVLRIEALAAATTGSVAVPLPSPSVAAPPRQPLASSAEPPSGSTVRPAPAALDEEDEATRGAMREPTRSSPMAAPVPPPVPESSALMRLNDDGGLLSPSRALLEAVGALVERVAKSFAASELEANVSGEFAVRVDRLLREAWVALTGERPAWSALGADRVMAQARAELVELGPLEELIGDLAVSEIGVVGHERITFVRGGKAASSEVVFSSSSAVRWAVARLCARSDAPLGRATRVERSLPDGLTLSALLEPGAPALVLIARPKRVAASLEDLVRRGTVSRSVATFLHQCLLARLNLLIVGPRDGGVELLTSALASAINESEVVSVGALHGASTALELSDMVGMASRAPLSRLFCDLSGPGLTQAVIGAASDGCDGIVASRAANSLSRGLLRLCAELRARYGDGAAEIVAGSFEVVVEVARLRDDRHRVLRVAEVLGAGPREVELADVFTFTIDRTAAGGLIEGTFMPASSMPSVADLMRTRGAPIDSALFTRPASR